MQLGIKIAVGTALIILLFCAAAVGSITELNKQKESSRWVLHTFDVISDLHALRAALKNSLLTAQEYALYAHDSDVANFNQAKGKLDPLLASLDKLVVDNPPQHERITILNREVHLILPVLDGAIALKKANKTTAAVSAMGEPKWRATIDTVVRRTNEAIKIEEGLLQTRLAALNSENQGVVLGISMLAALAVISLTLLAYLLWKSFKDKSLVENNLRTDRARLSESESKFKQMAGSVHEIFWITDPTGALPVYVSPAFEAIFGRSVDSILANPKMLLKATHPEDRKKVVQTIRGQLRSEAQASIEFRVVRADGEIRWLWARISALLDASQKFAGICGVTSDITEKMAADIRIREFYSMVSHELRTPLTSIRGSLGLIEGGRAGTMSPRAADLIRIGREESDRLIRLINDILDLKKIESGKFELNDESIQPVSLVKRVLNAMTVMAAEQSILLDFKIECDDKIVGDEERLTQVLTNLVSNAIKFSNKNESVVIAVTRQSPQELRFSVTDKGSGIPESQMHKLFNRFQQLDAADSRAKGGTGLGLAISKAIVECHEGKIGVNSIVGTGSTFWFDLPTRRLHSLSQG